MLKESRFFPAVQLEAIWEPDTDGADLDCTHSGVDLGASDTASTISSARNLDGVSTDVSESRLC